MARVEINTETLHGEKDQDTRAEVMRHFKTGKSKILIATDITARGIDIPAVNYVINYDLPEKAENYVHRVGRTGRGMNKGIAISFCSRDEKVRLEEIQEFLGKEIEEVTIGKKEYTHILERPKTGNTLEELIEDITYWEDNKKKKKKYRKPQK